MKIEFVGHYDRFYIFPAIAIVLNPMFNGYKYISISWFKESIEFSWDHVENEKE